MAMGETPWASRALWATGQGMVSNACDKSSSTPEARGAWSQSELALMTLELARPQYWPGGGGGKVCRSYLCQDRTRVEATAMDRATNGDFLGRAAVRQAYKVFCREIASASPFCMESRRSWDEAVVSSQKR